MLKLKLPNHLHTSLRSNYVPLSLARSLFDEMPQRRNLSCHHRFYRTPGCGFDAKLFNFHPSFLDPYSKTKSSMISLDRRTALYLLSSCVRLNDMLMGKQVHCLLVKSGYLSDAYICSSLVSAYSKCEFAREARRVFDEISFRDLVLWNVMVSGYALNGLGNEAFDVFMLMRFDGFIGDGFTFSSLLSACSSLESCKLGRLTHGIVIKLGLDVDLVVSSALVNMYAKCGEIKDAREVFDSVGSQNVVSWNAMIVGYGQFGEGKEAMMLLHQMLGASLKPDELTLASVISSCANMAATNEAAQVHNHVIKNGFQSFTSIGNALIRVYAKIGLISDAVKSFYSISGPDLVTWSTIVSSYAYHGLAKDAITMFEKMLQEGIRPDGVAFLGVLSACSHAGLVEAGLKYFVSMSKEYLIEPNSRHYACLVDLLGRAGRLDDAYDVLVNMCVESDANVLGAFIAVGFWEDVAMVRRMMRTRSGNKVPGCSWIEICGTVHAFVSNDKSYPQTSDMYIMLKLLITSMGESEMIYPDDDLALSKNRFDYVN
ncbi:pentatricopeptide repeat-containing protein At2g46050, mitochondrial isoform X2 [Typha latifolia]|uniref:pentatricopeptide repeat-containing protein At2g46050, mitochondrial isoform X2 n=1 Tax=Typha latifolia TaxID=4733 RepID=UPI003C2CFD7A